MLITRKRDTLRTSAKDAGKMPGNGIKEINKDTAPDAARKNGTTLRNNLRNLHGRQLDETEQN